VIVELAKAATLRPLIHPAEAAPDRTQPAGLVMSVTSDPGGTAVGGRRTMARKYREFTREALSPVVGPLSGPDSCPNIRIHV
jgi:hypothetical protein